jgi:hypothetical protein
MNMNNLRLSLVYLFGVLALAAAQEDEPSHRLLRGRTSKSPLRHVEAPNQPKVELSTWLIAKKEYANLIATTPIVANDSAMQRTEYSDDGIALVLSQSYRFPAEFLFKQDEPAAEYAVLPIETVENEYVSQSVHGEQEESVTDAAIECPSGDGYKYVGDSAKTCSLIRFFCEEDFEYFSAPGDCGCGCKPVA